jgi:hypothetical protein
VDGEEEVLFELFRRLREYLWNEYGVVLSLRSEGRDLRLRVGSPKPSDGGQPYYSLVVALTARGFRVAYRPWGSPPAEAKVTTLKPHSVEELFDVVRGHIEDGRRRLMEFRQR